MFFYEILRECNDPIQEAIDLQLANSYYQDGGRNPESIIIAAINEKYSNIPKTWKMIINLKRQGYTDNEIANKVNISRTTLWRIFKKMKHFPDFKAYIG